MVDFERFGVDCQLIVTAHGAVVQGTPHLPVMVDAWGRGCREESFLLSLRLDLVG